MISKEFPSEALALAYAKANKGTVEKYGGDRVGGVREGFWDSVKAGHTSLHREIVKLAARRRQSIPDCYRDAMKTGVAGIPASVVKADWEANRSTAIWPVRWFVMIEEAPKPDNVGHWANEGWRCED